MEAEAAKKQGEEVKEATPGGGPGEGKTRGGKMLKQAGEERGGGGEGGGDSGGGGAEEEKKGQKEENEEVEEEKEEEEVVNNLPCGAFFEEYVHQDFDLQVKATQNIYRCGSDSPLPTTVSPPFRFLCCVRKSKTELSLFLAPLPVKEFSFRLSEQR